MGEVCRHRWAPGGPRGQRDRRPEEPNMSSAANVRQQAPAEPGRTRNEVTADAAELMRRGFDGDVREGPPASMLLDETNAVNEAFGDTPRLSTSLLLAAWRGQ